MQQKARGAPVVDCLPKPLLEIGCASSGHESFQQMRCILAVVFLTNLGCAENVINIRGAKNSGLKHPCSVPVEYVKANIHFYRLRVRRTRRERFVLRLPPRRCPGPGGGGPVGAAHLD